MNLHQEEGERMLDLGIFNKFKSLAPYGVIVYLLFGGSGDIQQFNGMDNAAANQVIGQIEQKTPAKGIQQFYNEYVPSNLPGVNENTGFNLPQNSMGAAVRSAISYPMSILRGVGGTNYGY